MRNSLLRPCCCTLAMMLAGCWVDFPLSRLNRDGRPDWPRTDQVSQPDKPAVPSDALREAARDLGPTPERKVGDLRREQGFTCTADAFLACVNTDKQMEKCNASGDGKVTITCGPPGKCSTNDKRCDVCDPKTPAVCLNPTTVRKCSQDGLWLDTPCTTGSCQGSPAQCCTGADGDGDGYSSCVGDCNDSNKDVHPGQTGYFTAAIPGAGYDYNCSGVEEKQWNDVVNCQVSGSNCIGHGWSGSAPACGQAGTWKMCDKQTGSCTTTDSTRTQACH